jgi:hypothetical protein
MVTTVSDEPSTIAKPKRSYGAARERTYLNCKWSYLNGQAADLMGLIID